MQPADQQEDKILHLIPDIDDRPFLVANSAHIEKDMCLDMFDLAIDGPIDGKEIENEVLDMIRRDRQITEQFESMWENKIRNIEKLSI